MLDSSYSTLMQQQQQQQRQARRQQKPQPTQQQEQQQQQQQQKQEKSIKQQQQKQQTRQQQPHQHHHQHKHEHEPQYEYEQQQQSQPQSQPPSQRQNQVMAIAGGRDGCCHRVVRSYCCCWLSPKDANVFVLLLIMCFLVVVLHVRPPHAVGVQRGRTSWANAEIAQQQQGEQQQQQQQQEQHQQQQELEHQLLRHKIAESALRHANEVALPAAAATTTKVASRREPDDDDVDSDVTAIAAEVAQFGQHMNFGELVETVRALNHNSATQNGETVMMNVNKTHATPTPMHHQPMAATTVWPTSGRGVSETVTAIATATTTTTATAKTKTLTHYGGIRENVLLSSADAEREARLLYEQSLLEYHGAMAAAATSSTTATTLTASPNETTQPDGQTPPRTLSNVCEPWLQRHCQCSGTMQRLVLSCRSIGILAVPVELPGEVVTLNLGNNNITNLDANSFFMVPFLEELTLSDNHLINIDSNAFYGLEKLKRLSLQNCGLKSLPANSFSGLSNLISLQLNRNALASMDSDSLQQLPKLRTLRLEGNLFYRIPTNALAGLKALEALNLGSNLLTIIHDDDFPRMPNLIVLLLKRNQIMKISAGAFKNLTNLKVLELDENLISTLPEGLSNLTHLHEFSITGNRLRWINDTDLPKSLQTVDFRANPLAIIRQGAFRNMSRLRKLILSDVRVLQVFPDLEGCNSLETLKLDRAGLHDIPVHLCRQTPRLKSLELKTNSLQRIPNLTNCREIRLLDLSNNHIETLQGRPFSGLKQMNDLLLSYNRIKVVLQDAFFGIPRLQTLDLEGNEIAFIHEHAFRSFVELKDLNLGNNIFPKLPANGLRHLLHLKTFNNPKLRDFPAPSTFPRIQTLILSYAYHCCPFIPLLAMSATKKPPLVQEAVLFPSDSEFDMSLWNKSLEDVWSQWNNLSKKFGNPIDSFWKDIGQDNNFQGTYLDDYFEEETTHAGPTASTNNFASFGIGLFEAIEPNTLPGSIQCLPMPGPFLPCADLFDWWTLRCGVWVVFLLALLGNGTVVFVLIFSRSKMDVPRFLVCNLAAADFFMGIYLGILAIVDASTLGEFRMFAIPWQMSVVCQIAGFLAVLSSELSVFTLAVITLERNYAITHAIHLNKRLSLKQAGYIMFVGWSFALIMATLPLLGVSDYRKFAVCLPFETTTGVASLTYVIGLMVINGCAFLTLMGCYLKMYWAIRGSQAWNTNDSRIAKRMALLVFTDFLCWSPIAFFSITAIFGLQLISLEQAKIFTVFVLPLNSCCNPFLYAIMTKQFKKDCITLCKHFEETRVNRTGVANRSDRQLKELPPLLPTTHHPPGCRCLRMMPGEMPNWHKIQEENTENLWARAWQRFVVYCGCCTYCCKHKRTRKSHKTERRSRARNVNTDPYQYQFSEIRQQQKTRASSISSENFCSSRSSSWRNGPSSAGGPLPHPHHTCNNIPLKMMDPPNRRRHSAWLITRKTSQDSNLSSSRNDSSASATTASTSTFRLSRSSAGSTTPLPSIIAHSNKPQLHQFASLPKPRLVRQEAVQEEDDSSPPRLGVRFLPTIPSAADSSVIMDDGDSTLNALGIIGMPLPGAASGFYTVLKPSNAPCPNENSSSTANASTVEVDQKTVIKSISSPSTTIEEPP